MASDLSIQMGLVCDEDERANDMMQVVLDSCGCSFQLDLRADGTWGWFYIDHRTNEWKGEQDVSKDLMNTPECIKALASIVYEDLK